MALFHSSGIVTKGLVFSHDMNNLKSYQGEPTTNLFYNTSIYLAASQNWTNSGAWTANDNETDVPLPPINSQINPSNMRILSGIITTASNQGCQFGSATVTVSPSTTYTMSCYYMQSRAMANNAMPYMRTAVNNNSIASFSYNGNTNQGQWPVGQWIRITATGTTQSNENGIYLSQYFGEQVNDKIWMCGFQVEAKSYATPLVAGTRSNTQAIKDQTGNNTVTANSLTYSSDGKFTFNGSSNYMDCGNASAISSITGTSNVTVEAWVNLSGYGSTSGYGVITHKGYPWAWLLENPSNTMRIRFYLSSSGDVSCSDTSTHTLNTWYHFVGTYDGSNMRIYRNGELRNTVAGSGTLGGSGQNMVIGNYSGAYYSQGQIPIVRIYNRTLSAAEIKQNFDALKERYFGYQTLTLVNSSNITLTNNGTTAVTITKNADNNSWNGQAYSTEAFSAPCTIEFTKTAASGDNGVSYAMIGWNTDPTTDASYSSIDHAAYPYRQDNYSVYNNGSQVNYSGTWDPNKKFYIVYDTDGYIRHYNGSTLLYSANYGTNNKVYVDSSLYNTDTTYCKFTDVRVCRKSWNGTQYV